MNPTADYPVHALLDDAIAAEHAAQALYLAFAERFSDPPEVAEFWRSLANDEQLHAEMLKKVRDALPPERLAAPADPEAAHKARQLSNLISEDAIEKTQSLKAAYWLAHDLESSEVNTIFDFILTQFMDDETLKAFALAQLQDHVAKLMEPSALRDLVWHEGLEE
ncbi:MAG: hypothetical protein JXD18_02730 [Anaerolineae bacterium]|nr:hypothetical protein [Anaerolineae bacterium]